MVISFCEEGHRTIIGVKVICKHGVPSLSRMHEGLKQAELGLWRTTLSAHNYSEIVQCIQLLTRVPEMWPYATLIQHDVP